MREKLIALILDSPFNPVFDIWVKIGERFNSHFASPIADHLIANGVVVREKGEWLMNRDGSCTCKKCRRTTKDAWDFDSWLNFCPHCGSDMRGEQ